MLNPLLIASRAAGVCALALAVLSSVHAAPVLQMSAATSATGIDLTVRAQDVVDLYAYQFTLNYNPALLTALSGTEGAFLPDAGSTFFFPGDIDAASGSFAFAFGTLIGPAAGVNGSGDLVTFSFNVAQSGMASFSLSDVFLLNSTGAESPVEFRELVVQVAEVPEPASLWLSAIGLFALLGGRAMKRRTR